MDGDGIDDVVLCGDDQCMLRAYQSEKPGLLRTIQHEGGATTEYEYFKGLAEVEYSHTLNNPWPELGPWTSHAPTPVWPVKRITTSNNAPGYYARTSTQDFDYRDPMYDRWRRAFRGFQRTRSTTGNLVVESRYMFGGCILDDSAAQLWGGCLDPEKGKGWEPLNGALLSVDKFDGVTGVYHSTVVNRYSLQSGLGVNVCLCQ